MLARNNHVNENQEFRQHYALRKLTVGVASVLLSTTIYLGTSQVMASASTDLQTNAKTTQVGTTSVTNQQPTDANSGFSTQSAENPTIADVPAATKNVGNLVNSTTVSNVEVDANKGDKNSNNEIQPGTTTLKFQLNISADNAKDLQAGDYFDIQLGLPYTVDASGQKVILSYGRVVDQNTALPVLSDGKHIVGYLIPINSGNSYAASDGTQAILKNNENPQTNLGGSNGSYRVVFIDDANKYGDLTIKFGPVTWYNGIQGENANQSVEESNSFKLYSPDPSLNYIQATNDLTIGDYKGSSYFPIQVTHDIQTELNDNMQANTATAIAAHWWSQREDGTWVLGDNPIDKPNQSQDQSEGISLTKAAGNDFDMTVSVPDGASLADDGFSYQFTYPSSDGSTKTISYRFADVSQVKKDIERQIVETTTVEPKDKLDNYNNVYLGTNDKVTKPEVEVTSTYSADKKSRTYHVHIKGDYAGFAKERNGETPYQSTVTLLSWSLSDPTDLFPPKGTKVAANHNKEITYWGSDYKDAIHVKHVSGVMVNPDLIKALSAHPWKVSLSKEDDPSNNLLRQGNVPVDLDNTAGYNFVKNPQHIIGTPNNYGSVLSNHYTTPTHTAQVKQIIRFWYDQVGHVDANGNGNAGNSVTRAVTFYQRGDNGTWTSAFADKDAEGICAAFYDTVAVPKKAGYAAYGEELKNGAGTGLPNTHKEIDKTGFQPCGWFSYIPSDKRYYLHQSGYSAQDHAFILNVIYVAQPQRLNYQVVLEDNNGNVLKTVVHPTELATGLSGSAISNTDAGKKWNVLTGQNNSDVDTDIPSYASYIDHDDNNQEYVIVPSTDQSGLRKTSELPTNFDHNSDVDQLVTIYLHPKEKTPDTSTPTPNPDTPNPDPEPNEDQPKPTPKTNRPQVKNEKAVVQSQQQTAQVAQLPQTGSDYSAGMISLGMSALLMGLGLAGSRRKHD